MVHLTDAVSFLHSISEPCLPNWYVNFDLTSRKLTIPRPTTTQCKTTGSNYEVMTFIELQEHNYLHLVLQPRVSY